MSKKVTHINPLGFICGIHTVHTVMFYVAVYVSKLCVIIHFIVTFPPNLLLCKCAFIRDVTSVHKTFLIDKSIARVTKNDSLPVAHIAVLKLTLFTSAQ